MPNSLGTSMPAVLNFNSHAVRNIQPKIRLREACDLIAQATSQAEFIQSIALTAEADKELVLEPRQVTGLYYSLQDLVDRLRKAEILIDKLRI